jgi:hypothetical protein
MKDLTPAFASTNVQEQLRVISTWAPVKPLHNQRLLTPIGVRLIEVKPPNIDVFFQRQTIFLQARLRVFKSLMEPHME